MKTRIAPLILLAALLAAAPVYGQHAGFRTAGIVPVVPIAPAAPVAPVVSIVPGVPLGPLGPIAPMTVGPIQHFVTAPVTAFGVAPSVQRFPSTFIATPPTRQRGIPNTNITVIHAPGAIIVQPGGAVIAPVQVVNTPRVHHRPLHRPHPIVGTPRAHVIAQFGNPVTTVLTPISETLHYSGGLVVVLRNGVVTVQ